MSAAEPDVRRARAVELAALFLALPLGLALGRHGPWPRLPVIPTLLVLGAGAALVLWRDPSFDLRRELGALPGRREVRRILVRFVILGAAVTALVAALLPAEFLGFPRERPALWALVMVGYPALSVLPQELLWRSYFFHRFRALLPGERWLVAGSALTFGWVHVVFWNAPAVLLTVAGGALFAGTYRRTRSLWAAAFEHTLYGCLVFTVGLGLYFYGGTLQFIGGASGPFLPPE